MQFYYHKSKRFLFCDVIYYIIAYKFQLSSEYMKVKNYESFIAVFAE